MSKRVTGREALRYIDQMTRDVRSVTAQLSEQVAASTRELAGHRRQEAEILQQLARYRLSSLNEHETVGSLGAIDKKAAALLESHENLYAQQVQVVEELANELSTLEDQREQHAGVTDEAQGKFDQAVAQTQTRLIASKAYQAQLSDAEQAIDIAEQAERKVELAQTDRKEKGIPYEQDQLFSYLWARKFGTPDYSRRGLSKMLDNWVARLCGYDKARRNYYMLLEIPKRLAEHHQQVVATAEASTVTLRQMEENALNDDGVVKLRIAAQEAEQVLIKLDTQIATTEQRHLDGVAEQGEIARGENRYYRDALNMLVNALRQRSLHELRLLSLETPLPEDDILIDDLREHELARDGLAAHLREEQGLVTKQHRSLKEVEELRRQFKLSRYDSIYSEFKNWDRLAILLQEMLRGGTRRESIWKHLQRAHRMRRREADFDFGGLVWSSGRGLPDPFRNGPIGGSWGGGNWGGGSRRGSRRRSRPRPPRFPSSRGGRRGGGGFKTGGGF